MEPLNDVYENNIISDMFSQTSSAVEEQNNEEDSFFEHSLSDIRVNLSHQLSATNQSPLSAMHNSSFDDHEAAKSDDSGKDDDDDEKLEKCKQLYTYYVLGVVRFQ